MTETTAAVTFDDLWHDAGKPCCLCNRPLDPAEADGTGLAHLRCARIELENIHNEIDWIESEMLPYVPTTEDWHEYAAVMAVADDCLAHGR